MEITSHYVDVPGNGRATIHLEGLKKGDSYGTNLELTGQGNWFGSRNMCNLLADNSELLFARQQDCNRKESGSGFNMLELGSGLGRAGLMAAMLMKMHRGQAAAASWSCLLTDGEDEVVDLLRNNYNRNLGIESSPVGQNNCQQLWWGENAELQKLRESYTDGFDLIIGADLIYGRDVTAVPTADTAVVAAAEESFGRDKLIALLYTVNALLSRKVWTATDAASPYDCQRRPAFYLAVTRRELLPMEELCEAAAQHGLGVQMLEDYTFDIFDTCVDVDSLLWRDTILAFHRL